MAKSINQVIQVGHLKLPAGLEEVIVDPDGHWGEWFQFYIPGQNHCGGSEKATVDWDINDQGQFVLNITASEPVTIHYLLILDRRHGRS